MVRLYDDDLAERVQKTIGNTISRSVPYLAAQAFAAAMLEHQVLRTIPVGRHVLLLADVRVASDWQLAGQLVKDVHQAGEVRVIALRPAQFQWHRLVAAARLPAAPAGPHLRSRHTQGPQPGSRPATVSGKSRGTAPGIKLGLPRGRNRS